jgi:uncharacterized membrane protein
VKVKLGNGLIILDILAIILILSIHFIPSNVIRIVLGVPFLLFIPGYALLAAVYTKKEGMDGIARIAFSFILSLVIVGIIGIILNYTWGIKLEPILYTVFAFVLVTSVVSWWRQSKLIEEERYSVEFYLKFSFWGQSFWEKFLAVILVVAVIQAIGVVTYTSINPKEKEVFSEFYILGEGGEAKDYVTNMNVGVISNVVVGIINHEGKEVNYRIEVSLDGTELSEVGPITVGDEQKSEIELNVTPEKAGQNQKLEFLLYKDDETNPYLEPVYLWVDVGEQE